MDNQFHHVDCVRVYVPDLQKGLEYYRDNLGLKLAWKSEHEIGLLFGDGVTELVIQNEDRGVETDLKVESVEETVQVIERAGGRILKGPFDIRIGKCAIVADPWGNEMVILDSSKGTFITDQDGNIVGQEKKG